ncbi:MAG TPA: polysaccharide biosynthesis/export family protein, partial [Terriglobales bacterium]|nr:polysaccharide biosynthesis/export family protein [Terriglobales bacterium]
MLDFAQMRMLHMCPVVKGRAWLLCSVVLCAIPTSAQVQAASPEVSPRAVFPDAMQSSAVKSAAPTAAGTDAKVRLGIGDLVELSVYDVPELNTRTRVSSGGDLYLPLIDYVHVEGLTIEDAERVIERRLDQGGFVRSPHVQLFVADFASAGAN